MAVILTSIGVVLTCICIAGGLRVEDAPRANRSRQVSKASGALGLSLISKGAARISKRDAWTIEPGFFNAFSQGESTYDSDADGRPGQYQDGWEPTLGDPRRLGVKEDFFHESPSGGPKQAWQTHYPTPTVGLANHMTTGLPWTQNSGGSWSQNYRTQSIGRSGAYHSLQKSQQLDADFFDSIVDQYDTYGRAKLPSPLSPKRYSDWEERAFNSTMTCQSHGCVANTTLQILDFNTTRARFCKLSVHVHPTDYDRDYSGEAVQWLEVNGHRVKTNCKVRKSGCDRVNSQMLIPCISDLNIDTLMPAYGTVRLAAKIPDVVDECPYQSQMLNAIPTVTCLLTNKIPAPYFGGTPNYPYLYSSLQASVSAGCGVSATSARGVWGPGGALGMGGLYGPDSPEASLLCAGAGTMLLDSGTRFLAVAPLQCMSRGCTASTTLSLGGVNASTCSLTVLVNQTDFDGAESDEQIEYFAVDGVNISTSVMPGKNPCRANASGTPLAPEEKYFTLVNQYTFAANASVTVSAKISSLVDECAFNGALFASLLKVECPLAPSEIAATASAAVFMQDTSATEVPTRRVLRGSVSRSA